MFEIIPISSLSNRLAQGARFCYRHPLLVLLFTLIAGITAQQGTQRLKVVADLTELLPEEAPSVKQVKKLRESFGGVGYLVVIAQKATPEKLQQFARDIKPRLERLDAVAYVQIEKPQKIFKQRALYFLELDDLEEAADRIQERLDWERMRHNPLFVRVKKTGPPSLDFSDLKKRYLS